MSFSTDFLKALNKPAEKETKPVPVKTDAGKMTGGASAGAPIGQEVKPQTTREKANVAAKNLEVYRASDEYKKNQQARNAQHQKDLFMHRLMTGTADTFGPKMQLDQKEEALKAEADKLKQAADYEDDSITRQREAIRRQQLANLSEKERELLDRYTQERRDSFVASLDQTRTSTVNYEDNPLVQKYGREQLDKMADMYTEEKNRERYMAAQEQGAQEANKGFLSSAWGSTKTVGANLAGTVLSPLSRIADSAGRFGSMPAYSAGDVLYGYSGGLRGQVAQNIAGDKYDETGKQVADGGLGRQLLSYAYQGGMSAADSAARLAVTGNAGVAAGLAAMGSFNTTLSEAREKGATPGQAVALAAATAGVEALTEKLPLDNLMDIVAGGGKGVIKNILKQTITEIGEEEASLVLSLLAEAAILRDKSGYNQRIQELTAQGMSEQEARKQANMELLKEAGETALISGISGGMSAVGAQTANRMANRNQTQAQTAPQQEVDRETEVQEAPQEQVQQEIAQEPQLSNEAETGQDTAAAEPSPAQQEENQAPAENPDLQMNESKEQTVEQAQEANPISAAWVKTMEQKAQPEAKQETPLQAAAEAFTKAAQPKEQTTAQPEAQAQTQEAKVVKALWSRRRKAYDRLSDYNSVWAVALAMKEVNLDYYNDYMASAESSTRSNLIDAVVSAANDVRQETISPMAAATVINEVYTRYGEAGLYRMWGRDGNVHDFILERMKAVDKEHKAAKRHAGKNMTQTEAQAQGEGIKGTGAAERDFAGTAQYDDLLTDDNVQRSRSTDVRIDEVPKRDADGRPVSESVGNLMGSQLTSDEFVGTLKRLVSEGKVSHDIQTNDATLKKAAKSIVKDGGIGESAMMLRKLADSGRTGAVDEAKALLIYARYQDAIEQSRKKGEVVDQRLVDAAADICVTISQLSTNGGRSLQLFSLFRTMTPEGQIATIQKTIDRSIARINRSRSEQNKVGIEYAKTETEENVSDSVKEAKKQTAATAKKAADSVRYRKGKVEVDPKNREPFVFEYAQKVGEALAKQVERAAAPPPVKSKTTMQVIVSRLNSFAKEKMPQKSAKKSLTPIELLKDYIQNQDFYLQAWEAAQQEIRDKHEDSEIFSDFTDTGIGVDASGNPRHKIFARAIAAAAIESGETKTMIQKQNALGFTNISENIAQKLIRDTGATGDMAQTIRDAAYKYVAEVLEEKNADQSANDRMVETAVRSAMRDISANLEQAVKTGRVESVKQRIIDNLVKKYGIGRAEAQYVAQIVGQQVEKMATEKSRRILEQRFGPRKSPVRKSAEQLLTEYANLGAFDIGSKYGEKAAASVLGKEYGVTISPKLSQKYLDAKTQDEKREIFDQILMDAASRIPATFEDKWNAWRYMAMLGNVKTQVRNVAGNAMFVPYKVAKDNLAAAAERIFLKPEQRTKSFLNLAEYSDRQLLQWAQEDGKSRAIQDALQYSAKLGDDVTGQIIQGGRTIFKSKALEDVRKFVEKVPQAGDMFFKNPYYATSLAGFIKARGYTVADIQKGNVPEAVLNEARGYAIQEAMKATFNDSNSFSDFISSLRYKGDNPWGKAANILMEGVLPYRKTPANIVVRFTEYSPVGLVKGAWDMATKVKSGKVSAATAIDELASGITGTAAMGLGYLLASGVLGVKLRGSEVEEDEKRQGHQEYALEFNADGQEYSYKIDWAAPANLPLFVGANLYDLISGKGEDKSMSAFTSFVYGMGNMFEPMLALSCLSSLNDLFEVGKYSDGNALYSVAAQVATSYFTQGIPALLRQGYQASQEVKQKTFANSSDPLVRDTQRRIANIPIVGGAFQADSITPWGEEESRGSAGRRIFDAFFNPGTKKAIDNSELERELSRLGDAQEENVNPPETAKTISYTDSDGTRHENLRLNEEQYTTLAKVQGQTAKAILDKLIASPSYKAMTDAQKAKAVQEVYAYAREQGRAAALEGYTVSDKWMRDTAKGTEAAVIARRAISSDIESAATAINEAWSKAYNAGTTQKASDEMEQAYQVIRSLGKSEREKVVEGLSGTAAKYVEARQKGISPEDFNTAGRAVKTAKGTGKNGTVKEIDKREAIAKAHGLTKSEIDLLMEIYMPDYDPTEDQPETTEVKYAYIRQEMGLSAAEYAETYRAYSEAEKKREQVAAIQALGYDYRTAVALYNVYAGNKKKVKYLEWYEKQQ